MGPEGWEVLRATLEYIGDNHLKIADAKRGDIGNTSRNVCPYIFRDTSTPMPSPLLLIMGRRFRQALP